MSIINELARMRKLQEDSLRELRVLAALQSEANHELRQIDATQSNAAETLESINKNLEKLVKLFEPDPNDEVVGIAVEPGVPTPHES